MHVVFSSSLMERSYKNGTIIQQPCRIHQLPNGWTSWSWWFSQYQLEVQIYLASGALLCSVHSALLERLDLGGKVEAPSSHVMSHDDYAGVLIWKIIYLNWPNTIHTMHLIHPVLLSGIWHNQLAQHTPHKIRLMTWFSSSIRCEQPPLL